MQKNSLLSAPQCFRLGSQNALFQSNSQIRLMKVTESLLRKHVTHPKAHLTTGMSSKSLPLAAGALAPEQAVRK